MKKAECVALFLASLCIGGLLVGQAGAQQKGDSSTFKLAPLPPVDAEIDPKKAALGNQLFFDGRLSGDATTSCASCHMPSKAWCDGLPLSKGYPGTLYFRNTPTIANVALAKYVYWDGRLPAADLPTVVRDHISEAHFMQADGRLVIERLRQVPDYENGFREAFGGEPTYGRILSAVTEFLKTIRSTDVPLDRYLSGDEQAISDQAKRGLELFRGRANCIQCHHGPMLSDGQFHNLGLPTNPDIFAVPLRHVSFRRFMRMLGVSQYAQLRQDVGLFAVTKKPADRQRFRTPSLREVGRTAPYMHDGSIATLEDVVTFYNRGGDDDPRKDAKLQPLELSAAEQADLVEFLRTMSGTLPDMKKTKPPPYQLRKLGDD